MSRQKPLTAPLVLLSVAVTLLAGCSTPAPPSGTASGGTPTAITASASPSNSSSTSGSTSTSSSSPLTGSAQPTRSPVCPAAEALGAALTKFKDTLKAGRLDQVRAARDSVLSSYNQLIQEAGNTAKERVAAISAAEETFTAAVNDVPSDATLTEAIDSLRDEAAIVQGAVIDLAAEVNC